MIYKYTMVLTPVPNTGQINILLLFRGTPFPPKGIITLYETSFRLAVHIYRETKQQEDIVMSKYRI